MKFLLSLVPYSIVGLIVGCIAGFSLNVDMWKALIISFSVVASMIVINGIVWMLTLGKALKNDSRA